MWRLTAIPIVDGMFGTVLKVLEKKSEELKIRRIKEHTDHCIVKISLRSESFRDLKSFRDQRVLEI